MKLTKAQITALEAVERGEVSYHRGTRRNYVSGARQNTIELLLKNGLITHPAVSWGYSSYTYTLTDAGRAALESARQKEGK